MGVTEKPVHQRDQRKTIIHWVTEKSVHQRDQRKTIIHWVTEKPVHQRDQRKTIIHWVTEKPVHQIDQRKTIIHGGDWETGALERLKYLPSCYGMKPDGSYPLILNLKKFNDSVQYEHFKMDTLTSATQMMMRGCYLASVDLRYAYYYVPTKAECRKYLKFKGESNIISTPASQMCRLFHKADVTSLCHT